MNDGIAVLDKPLGMTSHDVVARVRKILGTRKVGHAGTLDPMASGILVLGIGRATRLLTFLVGSKKTYDTTIRLGIATTTDDATGQMLFAADHVADVDDVLRGVADLTGEIQQVPSSVSAIKVAGRRAHARVRAGETVALPSRPVTVFSFDVHQIAEAEVSVGETPESGVSPTDTSASAIPVLDVRATIECSAGTYVRALARDLGEALGVGGHVLALRRVKSGQFDRGQTLEEFAVDPQLLPLERAIDDMEKITITDVASVIHGRPLPGDLCSDIAALVDPAGNLLAIVEPDNGRMRYRVVFASPSAS